MVLGRDGMCDASVNGCFDTGEKSAFDKRA